MRRGEGVDKVHGTLLGCSGPVGFVGLSFRMHTSWFGDMLSE